MAELDHCVARHDAADATEAAAAAEATADDDDDGNLLRPLLIYNSKPPQLITAQVSPAIR